MAARTRLIGASRPGPGPAPIWIAASIFLVFCVSNAPAPLYVVWQDRMGFSQTTVSLIFVSYLVGSIAAVLFGGRAADRLGRRTILLPALGLAICACVLFATAQNAFWLEAGRFLIGVASGSFGAAGAAAIADSVGPGQHARAALYASVAPVAGSGFGPLLSGFLADYAPASTTLVFCVLIIPLLLTTIPLSRTGGRPAEPPPGGLLQRPGFPPGTGSMVILAMAVAGSPFALAGLFLSLGPGMIADLLGNDTRLLAGAVTFMVFTAGATGQFLVGRLRTVTVATVGLTFAALAAVLIAVAVGLGSIPVIIIAALSAGLGQSLAQLAGLTLARRCAPIGRGAEVVSLVWLAGFVTVGTGILGMGLLADAFGLLTATYLFCGFFFVCVVAALAAVLRQRAAVGALFLDPSPPA